MPAFVLGNAHRGRDDAAHAQRDAEVLSPDYVRTARAKGLIELRVIVPPRAAQRADAGGDAWARWNSAALLSGAVLTEQVFTIPGFGKLIVDAVFNRDYAGRAGRRAVHRVRLHRAQPARRHRLCADQSEAARR